MSASSKDIPAIIEVTENPALVVIVVVKGTLVVDEGMEVLAVMAVVVEAGESPVVVAEGTQNSLLASVAVVNDSECLVVVTVGMESPVLAVILVVVVKAGKCLVVLVTEGAVIKGSEGPAVVDKPGAGSPALVVVNKGTLIVGAKSPALASIVVVEGTESLNFTQGTGLCCVIGCWSVVVVNCV